MHVKMMYAEYINTILEDDQDCQQYLPINIHDDSLFDSLQDGVVLCKLIMKINQTSIDQNKVVLNPSNTFHKIANLSLALDAASKNQVNIMFISADNFIKSRKSNVQNCLNQIIQKYALQDVQLVLDDSFGEDIQEMGLLKKENKKLSVINEGEDDEEEEQREEQNAQVILLRWIKKQLMECGSNIQIENIGSDLADSTVLLLILQMLDPQLCPIDDALNEQDLNLRAVMMIQNAINLGIKCIVTPEDFIKNDKLKEIFCSHLFNYSKMLKIEEIDKQLDDHFDINEGEIADLLKKKQLLEDQVIEFDLLTKQNQLNLVKKEGEENFETQLRTKANHIVQLNNDFTKQCQQYQKSSQCKKMLFKKHEMVELNKKLKKIYDSIGAKVDTNLEEARYLYKFHQQRNKELMNTPKPKLAEPGKPKIEEAKRQARRQVDSGLSDKQRQNAEKRRSLSKTQSEVLNRSFTSRPYSKLSINTQESSTSLDSQGQQLKRSITDLKCTNQKQKEVQKGLKKTTSQTCLVKQFSKKTSSTPKYVKISFTNVMQQYQEERQKQMGNKG